MMPVFAWPLLGQLHVQQPAVLCQLSVNRESRAILGDVLQARLVALNAGSSPQPYISGIWPKLVPLEQNHVGWLEKVSVWQMLE